MLQCHDKCPTLYIKQKMTDKIQPTTNLFLISCLTNLLVKVYYTYHSRDLYCASFLLVDFIDFIGLNRLVNVSYVCKELDFEIKGSLGSTISFLTNY